MLEPQLRTPFGGMNQDDSLVTPGKDSAGKNMFEVGDYRYALNARIGSSRSDHFGDLENIRDTVEVTEYYAATQIFENTDFDGSLDDWLQLDEDPAYIIWAYNDNAARLTLTPGLAPATAPTFIAKGSAANTTNASINQGYMGSIVAGDLLVLVGLSYQEAGGSIGDINTPTGWTPAGGQAFRNSTPINVGTFKAFTKIATGAEVGSVNITRTGSTGSTNIFYTQMYQFRGTNLEVEDFEMNILGDGAATLSWPAVFVGGNNRTLIALSGQIGTDPGSPAGYSNEATDTSGGVVVSLQCDVNENVSSDGSVTASGGEAAGWATIHISIFGNDYTPTAFTSEVIYQTTAAPIAGQDITIQFGITIPTGTITSGEIKLVYMNGNSIISEETIQSGTLTSLNFNEVRTLPANTDGLGIRITGTVALPTTADLEYYQAIGTFISPSTRPTGTEKVIGKYEDYEFQRLYYCVWNSEGHHCIRYWDALNNYIVEVLQWEGLNWESDYFVKMAKLDNWMAFTDRNNPPRLIDVDTVSALKVELGENFREFHIAFHKWAPTVPAIPRIYYDGVTNNFDKLKDKVYHFSYRYIYDGNLRSRWSPISKGATTCNLKNTFYANETITSIEVDIPGSILDDAPQGGGPPPSPQEFPYFDHNDIKFTAAVKYIELAFRDGELELWKYWKRIAINPSFERLHYFNGEGLLTPVPQEDFIQTFDTVPFLAGTVEAIDNRFVFGDCLDEKPPVTNWNVEDISSVQDLDEWQNPRTTSFPAIAATERAKLQRLNALSNLTFKDRAYYKMGIQFIYPTGWRTGVYTSENWLYNVPDIDGQASGVDNIALNFSIPENISPPSGAVGYQIMRTNALNISYYMFGIVNQFTPIIDDVSTVLDAVSLPDDLKSRIANHFLNVDTITADEVIAETQRVIQAEIDADAAREKKKKRRNRFRIAANSVLSGGTVNVTHQLFDKQIEKWGRRTPIGPVLQQQLRITKAISAIAVASRIHIDLNNWVFGAKADTDEEFPLNKLFYNYTPGDRVRFVGSDEASPTTDQLKEYDVPIIEFTGKGIIIERPASLLWISTVDVASPRNFNIEIYTPNRALADDYVFYEMGEWYPILYPIHTTPADFAKRDFVWTDEASVTVDSYGPFDIFHKMPLFYGDSYNPGKTVYRDATIVGDVGSSSSPILMSMTPNINETFGFWDKNNGRPAIGYGELPVERFKPTLARFSGRIVEESFINNLNNMREEDQFVYPSEYGRIRDLVNTSNAQVESVGAILLAIGERETWSIYVNRTTLEDLSGRTQVSLADEVLGSFNTLLGSHGTLNPESVSKNRGRVWYWDATDGAWIRYGRDGLTEISEYKMRNWFSELGDLMITKYLTDEQPLALSEFDKFNDELVTFQDHSTLPATFRGYANYKGALFSEDDTRWKSCHNFTPEMMGKMNKQLIMFKAGAPYLYEKGAAHSTFFGVKYDVMWEPVFNDNPILKKAWAAFGVTATNPWSVERILSEYRGIKNKQETRIPITSFAEREDNYYASIARDLNTPNIANPVINGMMMRSKAIQVLMKLDPSITYLSLLHYVSAQLEDSPKNP